MSTYLGKFLQRKRVCDVDVPPPEIGPNLDTYLRLFNSEFQDNSEDQSVTAVVNEGFNDTLAMDLNLFEQSNLISYNKKPREEGVLDISADGFFDDRPSEFLETESEEDDPKKISINLYNLPYTADEKTIAQLVKNCKVECSSITLGTAERKKGLPPGAASLAIVLVEADTVDSVLDRLNGSICGGRTVRANRNIPSIDIKRRSTLSRESRYFEENISFKCNSCGQVGHRMAECVNEPIPVPCHLCAGADHDPQGCPNLICYRCGLFGHHSRECSSGARPRLVICFQCGSTNHPINQCPELLGAGPRTKQIPSMLDCPWAYCISCKQAGHTLCHRLPWPKRSGGPKADIYCPNCGEQGHHVDFQPVRGSQTTCCLAPKFEAFLKFPQLQKEFKQLSSAMDARDYYRSIARMNSDKALFPALQAPLPVAAYDGDRCRDRDNNRDRSGRGGEEFDRRNASADNHSFRDRTVSYGRDRDRDNRDRDNRDRGYNDRYSRFGEDDRYSSSSSSSRKRSADDAGIDFDYRNRGGREITSSSSNRRFSSDNATAAMAYDPNYVDYDDYDVDAENNYAAGAGKRSKLDKNWAAKLENRKTRFSR